ncbi:Uncharacterised protein [Bordetella pertussis]|nr:Uncharacterised protein [Bordetella pertussis]
MTRSRRTHMCPACARLSASMLPEVSSPALRESLTVRMAQTSETCLASFMDAPWWACPGRPRTGCGRRRIGAAPPRSCRRQPGFRVSRMAPGSSRRR